MSENANSTTVHTTADTAPVTRRFGPFQKLYLWEIFSGLIITIRHVVLNLLRGEKRFRVIEYPDVRKPMPERYKGAHRLTTRPDGKVKCVACMCCPTACPANCITIVAAEDPNDPIEKVPVRFEIDMLRCIYCGFCVEACPKDAIRMDTGIFEISADNRDAFKVDKDFLLNNTTDGARK